GRARVVARSGRSGISLVGSASRRPSIMRIAVIPGDGIGKEVIAEALHVLRATSEVEGRPIDLEGLPSGPHHYLQTGVTLPPNGYAMLRDEFDAILLVALGDPRVPDFRHAR